MPKHIGIVGVSPEGSSICYRMIGRRASEIDVPELRPQVSLHNNPFSTYVEALERDDWPAVAEMLRHSARALHDGGADFCILPDNALHHALPLAQSESPLPWLNMIDLVADTIQSTECQSVGVIGTKYVPYGSTYQSVLGLRGIKLLVPEEKDAQRVDGIIFREAIYGQVRSESIAVVGEILDRMAARGCEAIILGSSEAALMLAGAPLALPVFDPVELLAEAAIAHAIAEEDAAVEPADPVRAEDDADGA